MIARLIRRFRRQHIRTLHPVPDERLVLLSPGVVFIPDGASEEHKAALRQYAAEHRYEVEEQR